MAFTLAEPFINKVDSIAVNYVASMSQNAITAISPVITAGLTISFVAFCFLIMRGAVQVPVGEFLNKCLKTAIICAFAMAGGLYQNHLATMITELPDDLANAIVSNSTATTAGELIDDAAGKGFDVAGEAFEQGGFLSSDGLIYGLFGIVIVLMTAIVVAIGAAIIILSKLALAILAGLGPIFIFALLFEPTAKLFESWAAQVLNYVLMVVVFSAVFMFLIDIYSSYMADMAIDGTQNVSYALGGSFILSIGIIVVLLQIPSISGALSQGVGIGYLHELRAIRNAAGGASRAAGAAGKQMYTPGQRQADGSRGQASGVLPSAYRGTQRAAGYFKGKASNAA